MKKNYETPDFEFVFILTQDVVTDSLGENGDLGEDELPPDEF